MESLSTVHAYTTVLSYCEHNRLSLKVSLSLSQSLYVAWIHNQRRRYPAEYRLSAGSEQVAIRQSIWEILSFAATVEVAFGLSALKTWFLHQLRLVQPLNIIDLQFANLWKSVFLCKRTTSVIASAYAQHLRPRRTRFASDAGLNPLAVITLLTNLWRRQHDNSWTFG